MIGVGFGLVPIAVGSAIFATFKAVPKIQERKESHPEEHPIVNTAKACAVYYVPTVAFTVGSVCLIGFGIKEGHTREAALATAYTITRGAFSEYKNKVVEKLGEKAETEIRDEIAKDHVERNSVQNNEVIMTGSGTVLMLDEISGRYFRFDINKLDRAINDLNRQLLSEMYVSLNDFYYEVGLAGTRMGDLVGWNVEDGNIEVYYSYQGADNGEPCLVINFTVAPNEGACHFG